MSKHTSALGPWLVKGGAFATVLYVAAIVLFRWGGWHELAEMPLNELGDFLAGVFGPLALAWLIIGVVLQQRELQQNTRVLEIQAEELKNSVEQHKQLVAATRDQVEASQAAFDHERQLAKIEIEPRFRVSAWRRSTSPPNAQYEVNISNVGQTATDLILEFDPTLPNGSIKYRRESISSRHPWVLQWKTSLEHPEPKEFNIRLTCIDRAGNPYSRRYQFEQVADNRYSVQEFEACMDNFSTD